ncbi:probable 2-oxoisovalerate dehydrogenase alpha subunit, mitochondrial precursor [Phialocephala subalpina]|uniref:2-oxoisovalerate dehydrogenase subunit alpha n=1 Tax=Phialocephala subalpina TaxID=576137 RepID=A0A1L7XYD0_9HELO|nr:probable 2-oxoisovalerate dehydrogenase alpha subunit, mitochondrial precursor [Phialocephala subalpina]
MKTVLSRSPRGQTLRVATWLSVSSKPRIPVRWIASNARARFPGAVGSQLVTTMDFVIASNYPIIPIYGVMNADGYMEDKTRPRPAVTTEQALTWYRNMLTINIMDTIMFEAQRQGRISFYMASAGEEGITVGSAAALGPDDVITCQYRETGVFQQRGFTLKDFMSQLTSNKNDAGKGRNMPAHYSGKVKTGVHAVASTLGTQIPHATGAAYALKMEALENPTLAPRVAAAYFGDGAASEGDFHGALNIAATRGCPVIFICRNNGFAISTPSSEQYRGDGIASRAIGYGIDALRVNGTDIFAVYEATAEARRRALEDGGKPILLEMMSYRVSHHSTSDDSFAYRTHDEVERWKREGNPLTRLRRWLENEGLWSEEMEQSERKEIRKNILNELEAAEKEKKPALRAMFDDVYAELTEEAEAQKKELRRLMLKFPGEYDVDEHEGGIEGF